MKLTFKEQLPIFSFTQIPDVFFAEYLSSTPGNYSKVYLYILYLSKYNKDIKLNDLSKKLNLTLKEIQDALIFWENKQILTKTPNRIYFKRFARIRIT